MAQPTVITLTTDFGLSDHFVGTMKAVMLGINPSVQFIDVSHQVISHDVFDGALTVGLAYPYFPAGSVHLVVVDPGVGSARRPIVARTAQHTFVAPDNGVLSIVYEREESVEVRHVTADHYFLKPVSNTFHGRDVFAPIAAWLSRGIETSKLGETITDYVRFVPPKPRRLEDGDVRGAVIKVDKFGNLITNIGAADVPELFAPTPPAFEMSVNQHKVTQMYPSYSMGRTGEFFAIAGSSGLIEICQNRASAAKSMGATRGTELKVSLKR